MTTIKIYNYKNTPTGDYTIVAPLKHGSRWLSASGKNIYEIKTESTNEDWLHDFKNKLFSNKESEFISSKIKVKTYKKEIIVPNLTFVYRDPYDWFISSIRTAGNVHFYNTNDKYNPNVWNGTLETIDMLMTNNFHYKFDYWRMIYENIKDYNKDEITLVSLDDISSYIRTITLLNFPYTEGSFGFSYTFRDNTSLNGIKEYDFVEECKKCNPTMWKNFMVQIEKEREVLNLLIEKFKWEK